MAKPSTHHARLQWKVVVNYLLRFPRTLLYTLLPGWLRWILFREGRASGEKPRIHATSHLDGLRGFAAILVVNFHYLFAYRSEQRHQWDTWIGMWDNPVTEFFVSGVPMVAIFFVVSGYVISLKPLQLMHSLNKDATATATYKKVLHTLCSSVFRRAFRIYLPPMLFTLITVLTVYMGLWEPSRALTNRDELLSPGYNHDIVARTDTLSEELRIWWHEWIPLTNLLSWGDYYPHFGFQLWTIPIEYRSSIVLYVLLLALSLARPLFRFLLLLIATYYVSQLGNLEVMLFLAGATIAEYRLIITEWRVSLDKHNGEEKHIPIPIIRLNGTSSSRYQDESASEEKPQGTRHDEEFGLLDEDTLVEDEDDYPSNKWATQSQRRRLLRVRNILSISVAKLALYAGLLFSCYLLTTPKFGIPDTPGYGLVVFIFAPLGYGGSDGRWIMAIGAILILFVLLHMRSKRPLSNESELDRAVTVGSRVVNVLNCRFAQFLGRISFAIYIVHMAVLQTVGTFVVVNTWDMLRKSSPAAEQMGVVSRDTQKELNDAVNDPENFAAWCWSLFIGWLACIVVTVCVADVFAREVDGRCVKLARFAERVVFVKSL